MKRITLDLTPIVDNASEILGYRRDCLDFIAWQQTWGNTTCGHGGIGGQAITIATTVIVYHESKSIVAIYHAARLACVIATPNSIFWDAVSKRHLPGARETEKWHQYGQVQ